MPIILKLPILICRKFSTTRPLSHSPPLGHERLWQSFPLGWRQHEWRGQLIDCLVEDITLAFAMAVVDADSAAVAPDPGIELAVVRANLARIDPQALAIKLHRAESKIEPESEHFVVDPDAHVVVLGVEQVGEGLDRVTRGGDASRSSALRLLIDEGVEDDLSGGFQDGEALELEVDAVGGELPQAGTQVAGDAILEVVEAAASLLVFDLRLSIDVALAEACDGCVELHSNPQAARIASQAERIIGDIGYVTAEENIERALQLVGLKLHRTPRIDQCRAGIHPVAPVSAGHLDGLFGT